MIDPFNIVTDGYFCSPFSIATSGYLCKAIVQDSSGHRRAIYYDTQDELKRKMRDDEEIVLILSMANNLGII